MAPPQPPALLASAIISTALLAAFPVATVQADDDNDQNRQKRNFRVRLSPLQEVPVISSVASGEFRLRISSSGDSMDYDLSYANLEGTVSQAHIHLGQRSVNGGISVWLCGTGQPGTPLAGPAGTPTCPGPNSGMVSRSVGPADVVGPAGQGISAGQFDELIRAIRAGKTYANVHSLPTFGGGEIRGQIR